MEDEVPVTKSWQGLYGRVLMRVIKWVLAAWREKLYTRRADFGMVKTFRDLVLKRL